MSQMNKKNDQVSPIVDAFEEAARKYNAGELQLSAFGALNIPKRLYETTGVMYNKTEPIKEVESQFLERDVEKLCRSYDLILSRLADENVDCLGEFHLMMHEIFFSLRMVVPDRVVTHAAEYSRLYADMCSIDDMPNSPEKYMELANLRERIRKAARVNIRSLNGEGEEIFDED
jgi:hypothetical protein